LTLYGRVAGGQATVPPATYLSTFSGGHVEFRYRTNLLGSNCDTGLGTLAASPTFTINATVPANCLVATQNIDFGSKGVLDANVDATGQVTVTCTPSTAYTVSLNGGTDRRHTDQPQDVEGCRAGHLRSLQGQCPHAALG
jgi:spore coat protein U-like protein